MMMVMMTVLMMMMMMMMMTMTMPMMISTHITMQGSFCNNPCCSSRETRIKNISLFCVIITVDRYNGDLQNDLWSKEV